MEKRIIMVEEINPKQGMGLHLGMTMEDMLEVSENPKYPLKGIAIEIIKRNYNTLMSEVTRMAEIYDIWKSYKSDFYHETTITENINGEEYEVCISSENVPLSPSALHGTRGMLPSLEASNEEWEAYRNECMYSVYKTEALKKVKYNPSQSTNFRHCVLTNGSHVFFAEGNGTPRLKYIVTDNAESWKEFLKGTKSTVEGVSSVRYGKYSINNKGTKLFTFCPEAEATEILVTYAEKGKLNVSGELLYSSTGNDLTGLDSCKNVAVIKK